MIRFSIAVTAISILVLPGAVFADSDAAIAEVMQADREFAAMARADGIGEAFRHYASDDARLIGANSEDAIGPNAIFEARRGDGVAALDWDPRGGYAGEAGDFAVTYGDWGYFPDGDDSQSPAATGGYITVWRLEDGAWRYVLDGGYSNTPPAAAEE